MVLISQTFVRKSSITRKHPISFDGTFNWLLHATHVDCKRTLRLFHQFQRYCAFHTRRKRFSSFLSDGSGVFHSPIAPVASVDCGSCINGNKININAKIVNKSWHVNNQIYGVTIYNYIYIIMWSSSGNIQKYYYV